MIQFVQNIPPQSDSKTFYRPSSSPGSSFSSNSSSSDGDLLPDLWLEEPAQTPHQPCMQSLFYQQQAPIQVSQFAQQLPIQLVWNANYTTETKVFLPNNSLTEENLFQFEVSPAPTSPSSSELRLDSRNTSLSATSYDELFEFEPSLAKDGITHQPPIVSKQKPQLVNTQLYKTELCASFIKVGVCPYGNKCQFAHGHNELKVVERPPKWRSKPCVNWTKYGSCRYGNRCCFKHEH